MKATASRTASIALLFLSVLVSAEDISSKVKKAVERSTLDQLGTKPFHLKADLAPSFDRDKGSGRTGSVEMWWISPTKWRREVRSPEFHQIDILDGDHEWQKNEGDYFPEWLRQVAIELIRPVPSLDDVLTHIKSGEVRNFTNSVKPEFSQLNIDWVTNTGTPEVHNISRSNVALNPSSGLLFYGGGLGWGAEFKDYAPFHGRMIARTVNVGSPQVTAKVTVLEDLGAVPDGYFEAGARGGDAQLLQTVVIDEPALRKNLIPGLPTSWPPLKDGVLEGNVTTNVLVDREGRVREVESIVSENSAINDAGRERILALRFTPFLRNGVPVQVLSQITVPFKTTRPAGMEIFDSARTYFDRGRRVSFLAAGSNDPYTLHAEFIAMGSSRAAAKGTYTDTWLDTKHWRREASFDNSRYIRTRSGDTLYELADGPDTSLMKFIFQILEPIPATDTFVESDWRIKRDSVNGISAIRVLAGYESPEGKLDPEQARGYWFDSSGVLLKTFVRGIEADWFQFDDFAGLKIGRRIDVLKEGKLAARIQITGIIPAQSQPDGFFILRDHEWHRAFTAEER